MPSWNYATEIAADTPYLWYRMNETSGTVATDSGSNGENGTYTGTAGEFVLNELPIIWGENPGPQGKCVEFNVDGVAADDGHILRAALTLAALDEVAAEIWLEDGAGSPNGQFLFCYAVAGTARELALEYVTSSQLRLWINGFSQVLNVVSLSLDDGRAHHVYVDWRASDGRARLFVDGIQTYEATGFQTGNNLTSGGTLTIAQDQSDVGVIGAAAQAWEGRLDQFALYEAGLSDDRIGIHASAGLVRYAPLADHNTVPNGIEFFDVAAAIVYYNRVFDTQDTGVYAAGNFVTWVTTSADPTGAEYPGPGTFGVHTSDYCVEARVAG